MVLANLRPFFGAKITTAFEFSLYKNRYSDQPNGVKRLGRIGFVFTRVDFNQRELAEVVQN